LTRKVEVYEVSPRDGLQNEEIIVPTADKIRLVDLLSSCGFRRIEAASLVSARRVPQMADGEQVLAGISRVPGVRYVALIPNLKGYERAVKAGADEVAVIVSASEGFAHANTSCSVAESLERAAGVAQAAARDAIPVRGYISCVISCPYDGPTPPEAVASLAATLIRLGIHEISLGDTVGTGTPDAVARTLDHVLDEVPAERLAGHYHDTAGNALANIEVSLSKGLRVFDAAVGGLGGCPFAPGAKGNVDTGSVVALLHSRGFETGVNERRVAEAARFAAGLKKKVA
jgi:hydroxymethylglutaryl-CoA lyase